MFNGSFSLLMNKLSLMRKVKSKIVDCLICLRPDPIKLKIPIYCAAAVIVSFAIIVTSQLLLSINEVSWNGIAYSFYKIPNFKTWNCFILTSSSNISIQGVWKSQIKWQTGLTRYKADKSLQGRESREKEECKKGRKIYSKAT